jgi:hypothetical protein
VASGSENRIGISNAAAKRRRGNGIGKTQLAKLAKKKNTCSSLREGVMQKRKENMKTSTMWYQSMKAYQYKKKRRKEKNEKKKQSAKSIKRNRRNTAKKRKGC